MASSSVPDAAGVVDEGVVVDEEEEVDSLPAELFVVLADWEVY